MNIEEGLKAIGFNESESRVYLCLAEIGKATASLIAKRQRMPRTTVYSVLENLMQKGLVSQEEKSATTFFMANKPSALMRIIEEEKNRLREKEKETKKLVELIQPFFRGRNFSVPRLQFFEGKKSIEAMLYDSLPIWRQSLSETDLTWWGYQDPSFVERYLPWLEHVWKSWHPNEKVKLLSHKSEIEKKVAGTRSGREVRIISEKIIFSSTIWVAGDYIILIMTRQEPQYAFVLRDPVFSTNLRSVFQLLWDSVKQK